MCKERMKKPQKIWRNQTEWNRNTSSKVEFTKAKLTRPNSKGHFTTV